jgi:hypothetical protein
MLQLVVGEIGRSGRAESGLEAELNIKSMGCDVKSVGCDVQIDGRPAPDARSAMTRYGPSGQEAFSSSPVLPKIIA